MNSTGHHVRRATTEDLAELTALWEIGHLPAVDLEKSFTEFQVAVSPDGRLLGAIGMRLQGVQGWIHSETFSNFALADQLRPLLWDRLQNVARNHGLCRLWTQETAPFWKHEGFAAAPREVMEKLPGRFAGPRRDWLALQIRDEQALPENIDREFARFKEMERERTERMMQQASVLRWLATLLAIGLFVFVIVGSIYLLRGK